MDIRILQALLRKEFIMIRRNPLMPKVILLMPVMVMLVLPLVANLDVRNVKVAVIDNDHTQLSRRIINDLSASEVFGLTAVCGTYSEALENVEKGSADVVLTIPDGLYSNPLQGFKSIDIEANGINATKGMLGAQYVSESVVASLRKWSEQQGHAMPKNPTSVINLYNPTLNYRNYMIPALMGILLIIICGFLPTLNLVSEKERGTLDAINVSPVTRSQFVLAKLIPFWIVGILVVTVGIVIGRLVYGLTPVGNIGIIYLAAVLFSLIMSGLGLTIANRSSTMLQSIFVMFAFIIIFQLMSGLFTPIASMPEWAQYLTYGIPPRYFIEIMRAVYLKGTHISELWLQFALLTAFAFFTCALAAYTYRKRN